MIKVSDCCGASPHGNGDNDTVDIGICPECGEYCEYIEEEEDEVDDLWKDGYYKDRYERGQG